MSLNQTDLLDFDNKREYFSRTLHTPCVNPATSVGLLTPTAWIEGGVEPWRSGATPRLHDSPVPIAESALAVLRFAPLLVYPRRNSDTLRARACWRGISESK